MSVKVQPGRGEAHSLEVSAMPNEVLIYHEPDPEGTALIKINDIRETRYGRVIAVGEPRGRYREAPVKVGDVVVTATATEGVAVGQLHVKNRAVHRLEFSRIIAVAEDYPHE